MIMKRDKHLSSWSTDDYGGRLGNPEEDDCPAILDPFRHVRSGLLK